MIYEGGKVAGPEDSRLIEEFETRNEAEAKFDRRHHEDATCLQKAFLLNVESLRNVIKEMGNPFE